MTTRHSGTPLLRAVRMWSISSASIIAERVTRMIDAATKVPSVTVGSTRCMPSP